MAQLDFVDSVKEVSEASLNKSSSGKNPNGRIDQVELSVDEMVARAKSLGEKVDVAWEVGLNGDVGEAVGGFGQIVEELGKLRLGKSKAVDNEVKNVLIRIWENRDGATFLPMMEKIAKKKSERILDFLNFGKQEIIRRLDEEGVLEKSIYLASGLDWNVQVDLAIDAVACLVNEKGLNRTNQVFNKWLYGEVVGIDEDGFEVKRPKSLVARRPNTAINGLDGEDSGLMVSGQISEAMEIVGGNLDQGKQNWGDITGERLTKLESAIPLSTDWGKLSNREKKLAYLMRGGRLMFEDLAVQESPDEQIVKRCSGVAMGLVEMLVSDKTWVRKVALVALEPVWDEEFLTHVELVVLSDHLNRFDEVTKVRLLRSMLEGKNADVYVDLKKWILVELGLGEVVQKVD